LCFTITIVSIVHTPHRIAANSSRQRSATAICSCGSILGKMQPAVLFARHGFALQSTLLPAFAQAGASAASKQTGQYAARPPTQQLLQQTQVPGRCPLLPSLV
jgi:hypothetical protein